MTDSTLSVTLTTLRSAVCRYLGLGTYADLDADGILAVDMAIDSGMRQFYSPPAVIQNEPPHEWSFLKPVTTLTAILPYETGTVQVSSNTVTLSGGTWPTWAYTNGLLYIDGVFYPITERVDTRYLIATGPNVAAGTTFSLEHNGNYALPGDFGGIEGKITYDIEQYNKEIELVGEGRIRAIRQGSKLTGAPTHAAIRPMNTTGATGQQFEMMLWPTPDEAYVLTYRRVCIPDRLVGTTNEYPMGTAQHGETLLASCLAAAELQEDEKAGPRRAYFMDRLMASIQIDKRSRGDIHFGYNGDRETSGGCRVDNRNMIVTYDSVNPWEL